MTLFTAGQLLPHEFTEALLQLSPGELEREPYGPLLLLVRVPGKPSASFTASLEEFALRGGTRASLTGIGMPTAELPAVSQDPEQGLEPDQVGLLAELESSVHCAIPLSAVEAPLRIGRSRSNAVLLRDDSVSQAHAEIAVRDEGVFLTDVGSKNGTWVNGARLEPSVGRWLQPMDRLRFGRVEAFTCTAPVLRSVLRHRLRRLL